MMKFELWQLFLAGVAYLGVLFIVAYAADRGWLPARLARHPATYVLSLGVYATSWTYYGSVGFAQEQGYNFLTIYLGVTLAFLLTPVLLQPILRLTRDYQLASLADVFAFRYQSQLAGVLVTLFMLAGVLPYIALQIRAVTESLQVLTNESAPHLIALAFCVTITLFAILFGARHISAREKHEGLVVAIAFESLVKLAALIIVGLFAIYGVFGGLGGMEEWLQRHPEALENLYRPVREGPWATLLLLSFAAAFLLPRQFHMTFTENLESRSLSVASWGFPLFLLVLNLAIPPILWAGMHLSPDTAADFYVLGITLESGSTLLPVLTFIGGVSAASAMIIVTTLALAAMCMNHLVLPASFPPQLKPETDLYRWLLWGRRLLIAIIILAGYVFFLLLERNQGLARLGLISFVAVAQFLPGIVGLLYWRRATRTGFILGLLGGAGVWTLTLLLPLFEESGLIRSAFDPLQVLGSEAPWGPATFWSLTVNALLFVTGSLLWRARDSEIEAAQACCRESLGPPRGTLVAGSLRQIREQLALITGREMAEHEVERALRDLGIASEPTSPTELRRVRERIERNLSGLVGPVLARMIVDERLQIESGARTALSASVRYMEQRLEDSRTRLKGLAAELDDLRRYHRQVLHDLPLGVCSLGPDREVMSWNVAMQAISGIPHRQAVGLPLKELAEPWSGLLCGFLRAQDNHLHKIKMRDGRETRVFNLHKAAIEGPGTGHSEIQPGGTVILVEDLTDLYRLESELAHSERLASVGRLAAGVAHEVGNPVTGIACLAQNLLSERDEELTEEGLEQILVQTRRISAIVQSLVSFSHSGTVADHTPVSVGLAEIIDESVRLVRLSHSGKQLQFDVDCSASLSAIGDRQRLVQVFVNLLSNACDASAPGERIRVSAFEQADYVMIEIVDHGSGIDPDELDQVFEPFFTTKEPGEGTGLGLPMVYNIVQEHSGSVTIDSIPGGGIRVQVQLPAAGERSLPAPQTQETA
ncbi:sensor histidine kinase [Thiohalomonas denitrificans]|nr:ATP-binding protein [Thiohalomonas denitrificans]